MFCLNKRRAYPEPTLPIGTTYTITQSGEWECPATGTWQVELHGGGGGAATNAYNKSASGGGSGEIYEIEISRKEIVNVEIGTGGNAANPNVTATAGTGGTTTFGTLSIPGGTGGYCSKSTASAGVASGSIASKGTTGAYPIGGYGNASNESQVYGNGGSVIFAAGAVDGENGAVILTYLGS